MASNKPAKKSASAVSTVPDSTTPITRPATGISHRSRYRNVPAIDLTTSTDDVVKVLENVTVNIDVDHVIKTLTNSLEKFTDTYKTAVSSFVTHLKDLRKKNGSPILALNQNDHGYIDIFRALLQAINNYKPSTRLALQEVVADRYGVFLHAATAKNIPTPKEAKLAPLVKWGTNAADPHTFALEAGTVFPFPVVSLPVENEIGGVLAWGTLGHETVGHDILHAYGLLTEMKTFVEQRYTADKAEFGQYWSARIDDAVSDLMGVLFMGPAAAIGFIGYIRGFREIYAGTRGLLSGSSAAHPADLLRGYFMAEAVGHLDFDEVDSWRSDLIKEVDHDKPAGQIVLTSTYSIELKVAKELIADLVKGLLEHKWTALDDHSLTALDNWGLKDEEQVYFIQRVLKNQRQDMPGGTVYPAHIVAAAILASSTKGADTDGIFRNMLTRLNALPRQAGILK